MKLTRRTMVASAVTAGVISTMPLRPATAQDATPVADVNTPGYGLARVRLLPTAELNSAVFPDVLANFLPATRGLAGYAGYLFAWHDSNPAASITLTLLSSEENVAEAQAAAETYVGSLDPRFEVETQVAEQGPVRIYETTSRSLAELPPYLHDCVFTMRDRQNAPGADMDAVVEQASTGLVPLLREMPGFILYAWMGTEDGRIAFNVWETDEQLQAGNQAVADWVAGNTATTTTGDPVVNSGRIGFAELSRLYEPRA